MPRSPRTSAHSPVVDDDLIVRTWNIVAEEMWGLRSSEVVGRPFFDIDSGLPVEELRHQLETTNATNNLPGDVVVKAVNRRGRQVQLRVKFTPLHSSQRPGVVMLIEDVKTE